MIGKSKYFEVKEKLVERIIQDEFPVKSQLPSEPELAEEYNVSRGTIREALRLLADDGIISRRSGTGTFVIRKPSKDARVVSFREQVEAAGMTPTTKILVKAQIMASEAEGRVCEAFAPDLEQAAKTPVYCIDRLRCGDDRPLARQTIYLLAADFKASFMEKTDLVESMFAIYARYYRQVAWADEIIHARPATPEEVDLLEMQGLTPQEQFVYVRDRISYDQENKVLEVMRSIDRGDFFRAYRYRILEDEHRIGVKE